MRYREHRNDWFCDDCDHRWPAEAQLSGAADAQKPLLFLSYARRDASELADRLKGDLEANGYRVWLDQPEIKPGGEWEHEIVDGLRAAQLLVAVLTPSAVRRSTDPANPDAIDSVCLDEISFARFAEPPTAVVPVMAQPCEPPFSIFRLDYVDMCAWQDSEDRYHAGLQRLLAGVKEALGGKVTYRTEVNDLQPWDFAAFLFEKRRDFCGREWLFDEIDLWLKTSREPALLITGDPGTGKSALVAELVHRNPSGQVVAYHCCEADVLATIEPARFVRSIAAMMASQLPGYAARLKDTAVKGALDEETCATDPFSAFEFGVLTPLQGLPAPNEGSRYLLIDALDESLHTGSDARGTIVHLLSTFIERLPGWLRVVATTRKEVAVLQRLAGLRARELAAEDPRNVDDIEQYLRQQLRSPDLTQQFTHAGMSLEDAVSTLRAHVSGNFLYAQQVCRGLERGLYSFSNLDSLPPGLSVYYQRFFERQFPNASAFDATRSVLEVLVSAETQVTRESLAHLSGIADEGDLWAALRRLGALVVYDGTGFRVFHKSLSDWLTEPARAGQLFHINLSKARTRLSDAMLASTAADVESVAPEARASLLRQLVATGRWEQFDELVQNWSFIEFESAAGWAAFYPQLVQAADPSQRERLRTLPLALVNVGWSRASRGDDRNGVFMFYRAFSAILGLVKRDDSKVPWLSQFLLDVTGLPYDMPKYCSMHLDLHAVDDMAYAYMSHVSAQWTESVGLIERARLPVPQRVLEWRNGIRSVFGS
ncbi:MAG: toll/interleukin-1 receptor domain-containing protein [Mycobacterium sp.]|nr:toll/interleukin-1 receptor domain-containing protein [Mycobacterium sp.]